MKTQNAVLTALATALLCAFSPQVYALERLQIGEQDALNTVPKIIVPGGHSVIIEFNNEAYIQSLSIDDRAILAVAPLDRPLCDRASGPSDTCGSATILRLQRLTGALAIPGVSFSQDGDPTTLLTVITTDRDGRSNQQTYQFSIITTDQRPSSYSHISILPTQSFQSYDLSALEIGIQAVTQDGRADLESIEWGRLIRFMELIEANVPVALAIEHSSVSPELLSQLETIGSQASPSSLPM